MLRKYRILKMIAVFLISFIVLIVGFGMWFKSLIPKKDTSVEIATIENLSYLTHNKIAKRGKILTVVTSTDAIGSSGKSTGYELTELARAYLVFEANGFDVDVASPEGGRPPVVIDDEDMGKYDYAFLNSSVIQNKINNTIALEDVDLDNYEGVYFVGGKGAMFDFPENKVIQKMVRNYYEKGKVIGAVCHGPAALVNVRLNNGDLLLENKRVSSFTNEEELLLIPNAELIFPFLLQNKLLENGAEFVEGEMYLNQVSCDSNLITGQNPWSTWSVAENMIKQLGYKPKLREITGEENAVKVLSNYSKSGKQKAKELITNMVVKNQMKLDRMLIAKHSIIAVMKGEIGAAVDMINLVSFAKKQESRRENNN
ncbi:type 1 glutamine amidotransferase domain-containing protein [Tenacibaculum sp. M341]|uniref:type 1 glutamine amidotransferase domain-containing protein n=1 Tax=Tenacibaculum sp. M341 TaxID=2530339 RepID=UPI0010465392|nr:type 1 glutamine amidotransferase domain-containing protein [Tenacibaculum sp. M341]TCI84839.1 type 1 glutamine amidotransferase domain-containing protein [Tenacibaculum sp. M341]